jgi:hypothetical protein
MCQKAFGSYFAPLAGVPCADLVWTRGEPGRFRSSEAVERGFCRDCGTPLFYTVLERDRISVSLGSLDEPERVQPAMQHGIENRLTAFARLTSLPEETTEAGTPPELLARMKSRQHPDHNTEKWPASAYNNAVLSWSGLTRPSRPGARGLPDRRVKADDDTASTDAGRDPQAAAAGTPAIAASTAARAASALPPSGPPACAMSGRPPPPLPPSAAAPARTRSTAFRAPT